MIGQQIVSDKDGAPLNNQGKKIAPSAYQPSPEVMKLFAQAQRDYQIAYALQHRSFDEFDGISLLDRTRLDQQTFGAFVGAEYVPKHKRWMWRGRKNTARNKLIGILAHLLAAMLYPFVMATNEHDEEDKMTARVARILIEEHLRKAGYEMKFLFMVLAALVNPAVFVGVEYVVAMQNVKQRLGNGTIRIVQAVDELMTGVNLNIIPVDELMLADFYTFDLQRQPCLVRARRISWDEARKIYAKRWKDSTGKDVFDFVEAGKTRIVVAGQENQTLYDVEWTEADGDYVQELTFYYRNEDLQATFVGGVFMGEEKDIYNANPFEHRRMSLMGDEWISIPIYPFGKSGFEPIDPTGRFAYYKSGAFKEFWDDKSLNTAHAMVQNGTYLDVIKPIFMSGVAKTDGMVLAPGVTVGMPPGATATPYSLGPNITAAYQLLTQQANDMSESTQDKTSGGQASKDVTATATAIAQQQARVILGVFGIMIADLVKTVGELTLDCVIQYTTVGEVDATVPEAMRMKYKAITSRGKEKGRNVTNRIIFTDRMMGRDMTQADIKAREWELYDKAGGAQTDQRIYEVNPYKFARARFALWMDADQILDKSMGNERNQKILAFNMLSDPRVLPFTDPEAVADDFIIDEFSDGDPDRYKRKPGQSPQAQPPPDMLNAMMGGANGQQPAPAMQQPAPLPITIPH